MAAPRIRCNHCGDIFDRRQVTTSYCEKDDCRRAHERDRKREYRTVRRQLEHAVFQRAFRSAA